MTYRVRKQAITGKLILQWKHGATWIDADKLVIEPPILAGEFVPIRPEDIKEQRDRIAKYDRRAAAQKKSRAERAQPKAKELA